MRVTVEDLSSVKKVMHIEIPEPDVARELDKAYDNLKRTAKIKGFRPGKVPRPVLERMFKKDVHADVSYKLIQESFMDAIRETDLRILGTPEMDTPELDPNSPYKYKATVDTQPEIAEIDFKGLSLKKTLYVVKDAEVDAQLKTLQKNMSELNKISEDRAAAEGDFVVMDYEGSVDGKVFEETPRVENASMKIGAGFMSKDFDEQLKGMKPGDRKQFSLHFPEDFHNSKLAGQTVDFSVDLKEIREEVLPEINDDLAKAFGDYASLDDLKKEIISNLEKAYENRIQEELKNQIFDALIKKTDFELPDTLVDYELESIVSEAQRSFVSYNTSLEALGLTKESLSEKYRDVAQRNVRRHLILNQIIDQEKLELSEDELEEGYRQTADRFRRPLDEIKKYYEANEDNFDFFKRGLLEKKAIRIIIDNSRIENAEPEEKQETV